MGTFTSLGVGKKLLFGGMLLLSCSLSWAQQIYYTRTVLSAQTYTQISGGTVINTTGQLSTGQAQSGDDGTVLINLPFTFLYNGTTFTQATMCTNGWVGLGNATTVTSAQSRASGNLFTTTAPNNIIAAWYKDGNANFESPGVGSMVHGSVGTDVYAFEWRNAAGQGFNPVATDLINYMVKIYGPASSNPGRIEILYGSTSGTVSGAASSGIENALGGTNNYINALNGLSNSTATTATWPGNGNGVRFDPIAAPANDLCANAVSLTVGAAAISGTLSGAAPTSGATKADVWYTFTTGACAQSYTPTINTFSPAANRDIYIFSSCPANFTGQLASGTTTSTANESATFSAAANTTYYIAVQDVASLGGTFNISIPTPTAGVVTSNTGTPATGSIIQGSNDQLLFGFQLAPNCVTFDFTQVIISKAGTSTTSDISNIRLYRDVNSNGTYESGTDVLASASTPTLAASMTFTMSGQTSLNAATRYLLVGDVLAGATVGRTFTGSITPASNVTITGAAISGTATGNTRTVAVPPPANDNCANATSVTPALTCTTISGSNTGATQQFAPTSCSSSTSSQANDVWYTFTANGTSNYEINVNSTFDGVLGLYSGCSTGNLVSCTDQVTSNATETITAGVLAAGTYYYRFYGWNGASGNLTTCVTNSPPFDPCNSITNIAACGSTPYTAATTGTGSYNFLSCDGLATTPGKEQIYTFTPAVTGDYTINVTAYTNYEDVFYKVASSGCNNSGWTCHESVYGTGALSPMTLTAGTQYYIMFDSEITGANSITFNLDCPPLPGCITSAAPANAATNQCTNATLSWAAGTGNPTGYRITMGTNAPNYDNIANNVDLGNVTTYSPVLSPSTTYGWKVVPYNGIGQATGCSFNTFTTGTGICYCVATSTSGSFEYINTVASGAFTNANATNSLYADYTSLGSINSGPIGGSFNVDVTVTNPYAEDAIFVFADFNQDGDFNDAGELAATYDIPAQVTGNATYTVSVNVPISASLGTTRMRIKMGDAVSTTAMNSQPCQTYTYGEVEDYNFTVIFVPCTNPTAGGSITGPVSGSVGGVYTYNATGQTGDGYIWQAATSFAGPYNDISGTANTPTTNLGVGVAGTYYVRTRSYSAGCAETYSNVITLVISSNDDVCNASLIPVGFTTFPVDNSSASAQTGEPIPPHTSCGSGDLGTWCNLESTPYVQHSLWYKFVAPTSGRVIVSTVGSLDGFGDAYDSQLAVYAAASCSAVTSGGATLLGANDDNFVDLNAEIPVLECLIPGQTYYIQVDGYGTDVGSIVVTVDDLGQANPPTINGCPSDIVSTNPVVSWTAPTASDNCPGVTLTTTHTPGSNFPLGVTTVTYTATDINTQTATCSFNVNVVNTITWTGNTSTDWFTATNWAPNTVPNACGVAITIPTSPAGGVFPVINGTSPSVGNITVQSNANITINAGKNISVCGNWIGGSGSASQILGAGVVVLNGSSSQQLSGKTQFQNLQLNNATGANMQAGSRFEIFGEVALQSGTLSTGSGQLVFRSTSDSQIGIIDNFSPGYTGTISGTISAERYYHSSATYDAHFMGSPVDAPALSEFATGGTTGYAIPTANCDETQLLTGSPYGAVASMDESVGAGCAMKTWKFENTATPAQNAKGYSVRKTGAGVITVNGNPNLDASYAVNSLNNTGWPINTSLQGRPMGPGWHLISNPYLANLDISSTPAGFDVVKLVWINDGGGSSGTYQPATVVAPFQAFMVHRIAPGAAPYTVNATQRTKNAANYSFQKQGNDHELTLTAINNGTQRTDVTKVAFNSAATVDHDPEFDCIKIAGALDRHTLYTYNSNPLHWTAINTLNSIEETSTVNVGFEPGINGSYTLQFDGLNTFDPTSYITLEDKKLNVFHDVRSGNYSFTANANDDWNRFVLHFTPAAKFNTADATCAAAGQVNIEQPGTANWNYVVTNGSNVTISSGVLNNSSPVTVSVPNGVYTVTLTDNNNYTVVKNVLVNGVSAVTAAMNVSKTTAEEGEEIDFVNTSSNATSVLWEFGDGANSATTNASHTYSQPGVYNVKLTVSSIGGCVSSTQQTVTVTAKTSTGITDLTNGKVTIWSHANMVYVDFSKAGMVQSTVDIYNILGQVVSSEKFGKASIYSRQLNNLDAGYVIVSVKSAEGTTTKKVFISNSK